MEPLELITRAEERLQRIYKEEWGLAVDVASLECQLAIAKLLLTNWSQNVSDRT